MKAKAKKTVSLLNATSRQVCRVDRDNLTVGGYWVIANGRSGDVSIYKQNLGEMPTAKISVPNAIMRKMVKFLTAERVLEPR